MSERDEYTPSAEKLQEAYEYWVAGLGSSDGREVERFLAAHDKALSEQIAREIEARRDRFIDRAATQYEWGLPAWANAYLNGLDDAINVARGEGSE